MINISRSNKALLITSDNNQFPWKDGKMSVPLNSIAYIIDESDYVTFRSVANNDILFTSLIGELKINDESVSKDDLITMFDSVANSSGSGGGTASAGVNSINGYQGDVRIKTVNGTSLIGSGDITIEGGSSVEEVDPIFTEWKNGNSIALGNGAFSDEMGIAIGSTAESTGQSIAIGRNAKNTTFDQVAIGYGIKNDDEFYTNINNVIKGDANKHAYIKDNDGNYNKILDIINNICSSVEETDPIFTEWKNADDVIVGNGAKYDIDGASEEDIQPSIMIGKGASVWASGIAIGENAYSESGAVTIGKNVSSYGIVSIGSDNEGSGIAIGKNNKGSGIAIGENNNNGGIAIGRGITENYGGIAIGDNISNPTDTGIAIGMNAKISTKNPEDTENGYGIAIGCASIAYDKNDVAIGKSVSTDDTYTTNINNIIKGNMNKYAFVLNEYGNYVRIPTEWTGTQSQYNALGTYYDNITYNIIED